MTLPQVAGGSKFGSPALAGARRRAALRVLVVIDPADADGPGTAEQDV